MTLRARLIVMVLGDGNESITDSGVGNDDGNNYVSSTLFTSNSAILRKIGDIVIDNQSSPASGYV